MGIDLREFTNMYCSDGGLDATASRHKITKILSADDLADAIIHARYVQRI